MKRLEKITFLIHGFCYACLNWGRAAADIDERQRPYIAREEACAEKWFTRLGDFSEAEALVIIPFGRVGPAEDYFAAAEVKLGERCFMLDCPDCHQADFWASHAGDQEHSLSLLSEIQSAFLHQQMAWNKEEIYTALHSLACCQQFQAMLAQRDLCFDPATVRTEAWGASFDGCVTKYTLNLRRILGLAKVIEINFALTVPDAAFLLNAELKECLLLAGGLRLFIFAGENRFAGLYTFTEHSLADKSAEVVLTAAPEMVSVRSKQGIRLWPQAEEYLLQNVELGYYEPPQAVVKLGASGLQLPVSAGFVYRLAKAPVYVFMPEMMPYADVRTLLAAARLQLS